jgi:multimeric flavodoxin WrbA
MATPATPLRALALVCSLKRSPAESSSALMAEHVCEKLRDSGVKTESLRMVDYSILPGVEADMGDGDEWPKIRQAILDSDILVVSTPVWVGHPSSIAQRVLERLDAELSNTDDGGRPVMVGKVAIVAVVGNEDGAHKIIADMFPGPQRHRLYHRRPRRHVLERRGHADQELQRSRRGSGASRQDHRRGSPQCGFSGWCAAR